MKKHVKTNFEPSIEYIIGQIEAYDFNELEDTINELNSKGIIDAEYDDLMDILRKNKFDCVRYIRQLDKISTLKPKDIKEIEMSYVEATIHDMVEQVMTFAY